MILLGSFLELNYDINKINVGLVEAWVLHGVMVAAGARILFQQKKYKAMLSQGFLTAPQPVLMLLNSNLQVRIKNVNI